MPNLAQMYTLANSKSMYSRQPGEIYSALEESGFKVYAAVLKEYSGFFLKFDTTTIVLTPGVQQYACPPDLTMLVNLAERRTSTSKWRVMDPTTLEHSLDDARDHVSFGDYGGSYGGYGNRSRYKFYGPYLPALTVGTSETQIQQINIEPAIIETLQCEIAYTAKWLPVVNANSVVMLPNEGTYAMQSFAIAELTRSNNDTLSSEYEAKGEGQLTDFLTWVRGRQISKWPTIEPYGP
jgi:hypothetical protein